MRIALATDHGGFEIKEFLKTHLLEEWYEVEDFGTHSPERCDFPDYVEPAARSVASEVNDYGICICKTWLWMSMLANKIKWVRAAVIYNEHTAISEREHNNANILCLGGCQATQEELVQWVEKFFASKFLWGRYQERIDMLEGVYGK